MPETVANDWAYHKSGFHLFLQRFRHLANNFSLFAARESITREVEATVTMAFRQLHRHKYTYWEKHTE